MHHSEIMNASRHFSHVRTSIHTIRRRAIYDRAVRKFTFFCYRGTQLRTIYFACRPVIEPLTPYLLKSDSRAIRPSPTRSLVQGASTISNSDRRTTRRVRCYASGAITLPLQILNSLREFFPRHRISPSRHDDNCRSRSRTEVKFSPRFTITQS